MKNKSPKKQNAFAKNFKVLKLVFKFCPGLIPLAVIYIICAALSSLARVYLIKEAITIVLSGGTFEQLITSVVYILGLELICIFGNVLYEDFFEPRYRNIYIKKIHYLVICSIFIVSIIPSF